MGQNPLPTGSSAYFYLGVGAVGLVASLLARAAGEYTIVAGPLRFDTILGVSMGATVLIVLSIAGLYESSKA